MAASTVYDIKLRYLLKDEVSRRMGRIVQATDKASKSAGLLSSSWARMAAFGASAFGFHKASKALIGFNDRMQQAQVQMGGMIALNTSADFAGGFKTAGSLLTDFQEIAKKSVGTTQDFVDMAAQLTRPITAAGMGMEDLKNLTKGAVIASRAFGIESGMAARDIESALMGQLRSVDRFSRALLEPLGVVGEEGREAFNAMAGAQRAAMLKNALSSDTINAMAEAQGMSFSGVMSTFQDQLQITLGQVGLPLFKALTAELQGWNGWIEKNGDKIREMAQSLGSGIKNFALFLKDVGEFLVSNRTTILTVAKAFAVVKGGQILGGMAGGLGRMAHRGGMAAGQGIKRGAAGLLAAGYNQAGMRAAGFGAKVLDVTTKFSKFVPAIGLATGALVGLYSMWKAQDAEKEVERRGIADVVAAPGEEILRRRGMEEKIQSLTGTEFNIQRQMREDKAAGFGGTREVAILKLEQSRERLREKIDASSAAISQHDLQVLTVAQKYGLLSADLDNVNQNALNDSQGKLRDRIDMSVEGYGNLIASVQDLADRTSGYDLKRLLSGDPVAYQPAAVAETVEPLGSKGKSKVNVTIQRIEVKSDDPDRFVFGMVSAFSDAAKNPSSALDTFRE